MGRHTSALQGNYIKNHENMKGFGLTVAIFVISGFESGYRVAGARRLSFTDRLQSRSNWTSANDLKC